MSNREKKAKVAVAMSGGVDSSTAAYLLKKQGYEVFGLFMRLGNNSEEAETAARRVARFLGLTFYPLNLKDRFEKEVIAYFLKSYGRGLTPNPCVKCNQLIKFGELLKRAEMLGADYLATGHYVKIKNEKLKMKNGRKRFIYKLSRGKDETKDQSYFLYNLKQRELARLLFPLGDFRKEKIKKTAARAGLPNLKSESQDICFLQQNGKALEHNEFLKKHLRLKSGAIKTLDGKKVGEHQGLPLYTIGQRKGVEIGGIGPFYVVQADCKNNTLYVAKDGDDPALYKSELRAEKVSWIAGLKPKMPLECEAVIRYRHKPVKVMVSKDKKNSYSVNFREPQRAITPGQSVVFYHGDEVLGGGEIGK